MFFDDLSQIPEIALSTGCSVFVVNQPGEKNLERAFSADRKLGRSPLGTRTAPLSVSAEKRPFKFFLRPTDKPSITVEQVRDFTAQFSTKQQQGILAVITPADAMSASAQNAFLKNLEEPAPYIHYVLITTNPAKLLPTILSRAQVFYHKTVNSLSQKPTATPEVQNLAKQLITAKPTDLPALATTISKSKDARTYALDITATAIELLYKSYFKTHNPAFLDKIPRFTMLYDNLAMNGHIKLHLVADLC
ncbi:hypothetical protein IJI91_02200 [Candidatus Saccharibacteria bacterium]|nr:hypothetical protein [Candidatus Saccharibacteria bacterium]